MRLTLLALITLVACTEETITSRDYPRVMSRGVEDISADGALFKGEIIFSPGTIADHGFLWTSVGFPTLGESDYISLGPRDAAGTFEARIERNMEKGETYSMWAYARSADDRVVYGELVEFVSEGCSIKPSIADFFPKQGSVGDIVTVEGEYFSMVKFSNKVLIGSVPLEVLEVSETRLVARILPTSEPGEFELTVISNGASVTASGKFTLE